MKWAATAWCYQALCLVLRTLFTWTGRVGRKTYWFMVGWAALWLEVCHQPMMAALQPKDDSRAFDFFNAGIMLLVMFVYLVVMCKRLHDFNASGWWLLTLLLQLAYEHWVFRVTTIVFVLVCGVVKGTDGANRFGEKPQ